MSNRTWSKAKKVSLSGILIALTVISLFLSVIVPTNTLSFYALSSFFISIIIMEFGTNSGWAFYAASSILALIILPDKIGLIPYVAFFGLYGLIKFYIERLKKLLLEYILKIAYFTAAFAIAWTFAKEFFSSRINIGFPLLVLIIILEIAFIVYDYVYTLFIQYYNTKLRNML